MSADTPDMKRTLKLITVARPVDNQATKPLIFIIESAPLTFPSQLQLVSNRTPIGHCPVPC